MSFQPPRLHYVPPVPPAMAHVVNDPMNDNVQRAGHGTLSQASLSYANATALQRARPVQNRTSMIEQSHAMMEAPSISAPKPEYKHRIGLSPAVVPSAMVAHQHYVDAVVPDRSLTNSTSQISRPASRVPSESKPSSPAAACNIQSMSERARIVELVANILNYVVLNNSKYDVPHSALTRFHAQSVPDIGVKQYLERIAKYSPCSNECFVLALIYIDRMVGALTPYDSHLYVHQLNIHRLLITAVMLAAKFNDDTYYNNVFYARVGGVAPSEMNALELEFLFRARFDLCLARADYDHRLAALERFATASAMHRVPAIVHRAVARFSEVDDVLLMYAPRMTPWTGARLAQQSPSPLTMTPAEAVAATAIISPTATSYSQQERRREAVYHQHALHPQQHSQIMVDALAPPPAALKRNVTGLVAPSPMTTAPPMRRTRAESRAAAQAAIKASQVMYGGSGTTPVRDV